jgi:hypothetical protein
MHNLSSKIYIIAIFNRIKENIFDDHLTRDTHKSSQNRHPFIIKILIKIEKEWNFLNPIKLTFEKSIVNTAYWYKIDSVA